jgi:hypothetical protein
MTTGAAARSASFEVEDQASVRHRRDVSVQLDDLDFEPLCEVGK